MKINLKNYNDRVNNNNFIYFLILKNTKNRFLHFYKTFPK